MLPRVLIESEVHSTLATDGTNFRFGTLGPSVSGFNGLSPEECSAMKIAGFGTRTAENPPSHSGRRAYRVAKLTAAGGPGLGVELDEAVAAAHPYNASERRFSLKAAPVGIQPVPQS